MVNWVVDRYMFERREAVGDLEGAIRRSGANIHVASYVPLADEQDYGPSSWIQQPTVLYGTIGYVRKCKRPYIPGALGLSELIHCNHYYSHIPNHWMLNEDFIILPWSKIVSDPWHALRAISSTKMFVRPISGHKTFTGRVFDGVNDDLHLEISSNQQLSGVMPETLCLCAPAREIQSEFRFVIADNQVVTGSEYRWDGVLDIRRDWPPECEILAQKVAELPWQPDRVYTCDVALVKNNYSVVPRVVELNGFSSAGLYASDLDKVVEAVNRVANSEWEI